MLTVSVSITSIIISTRISSLDMHPTYTKLFSKYELLSFNSFLILVIRVYLILLILWLNSKF